MEKLDYKEIKTLQKKSMKEKNVHIDIYRKVSTPFTYLFYKLGFTANGVTLLSIILVVLGGIVMIKGSYFFILFGLLCFILFRILDDSDGELARILKSQSKEGVFFDRISHYFYTFFLAAGLAVGLAKLLNFSIEYVFVIAVSVLSFTLEDNLDLRNFAKNPEKIREQIGLKNFASSSKLMKIFSVSPFQGLLYKDRFFILILFFLVLISHLFNFVIIYLFVVLLSKTYYITRFLSKMYYEKYLTKS